MSDVTTRPKRIQQYFHCAQCLRRTGARSYKQHLEVGMTDTGSVQVWCRRCNSEVINLVPPKPREQLQ